MLGGTSRTLSGTALCAALTRRALSSTTRASPASTGAAARASPFGTEAGSLRLVTTSFLTVSGRSLTLPTSALTLRVRTSRATLALLRSLGREQRGTSARINPVCNFSDQFADQWGVCGHLSKATSTPAARISFFTSCCCSGSEMVTTVPSEPARAVRPERCR